MDDRDVMNYYIYDNKREIIMGRGFYVCNAYRVCLWWYSWRNRQALLLEIQLSMGNLATTTIQKLLGYRIGKSEARFLGLSISRHNDENAFEDILAPESWLRCKLVHV